MTNKELAFAITIDNVSVDAASWLRIMQGLCGFIGLAINLNLKYSDENASQPECFTLFLGKTRDLSWDHQIDLSFSEFPTHVLPRTRLSTLDEISSFISEQFASLGIPAGIAEKNPS